MIWTWFGFKKSDVEQKKVICKMCGVTVTANKGNTSNLFSHLKSKHVLEYAESQRLRSAQSPANTGGNKNVSPATQQQPSIAEAFSKSIPYDRKSKRWNDITRAITTHLCKDMVPFQTVERSRFKDMIKTLDPRYEPPSRKYFTEKEMPKLYGQLRERVENDLRELKHYATTTDLWSSCTMEPYISLTIHYITDEWKVASRCLQTSYFPDDHTGEAIAEGLKDALESWGLREESQVCITTDNGTNVVKAVPLNDWRRLQCFGHRLHLAIGKLKV